MRAATALLAAAVTAATVVVISLLLQPAPVVPRCSCSCCSSSQQQCWFTTGLVLPLRLQAAVDDPLLASSTGKRFSEMAVETAADVDEGNDVAD